MPRLTRHYEHWPADVPRTLPTPQRTLYSHLAADAAETPDRIAIDYYGGQTSYLALNQAVVNLAGYLQQRLGVARGDRVLLMMQNCTQFVIGYYAILRANAVVVTISPMSTAEEIAYFVADSGGRVMIIMQDMLDSVLPLLADKRLAGCVVGAYCEMAGRPENVPFMQIPDFVLEPRRQPVSDAEHDFATALAAGIRPTAMACGGSDLAVIAYTSGTTGKPKGAMLSHRAWVTIMAQRALWLGDPSGRSDLIVLPMGHIAGMGGMNQAIYQARTMIMLARWDASAVPELIERHRINRWVAVTPMLVDLMARPELAAHDISSLKRLYGGAIAMPEAVAREVKERLGVPFIECYGMTETCGATHLNPPQATRLQCAGIPQIDVDARVIDPESGAELGPNQHGEIIMNAPIQFDGYWNKPDATREAFLEIEGRRFFRTGDIGYYDEDGFFYITDRLKRMINAAGMKVWPTEIENLLFKHPAVREACVISAYDERRGETVKALIVLKETARGCLTPDELIDWAREQMAVYKIPRLVEFVDSLPKTVAGKVLWRVLQEEQNQRDRKHR